MYFDSPQLSVPCKKCTNLYTSDPEIMLNFEKTVSLRILCYYHATCAFQSESTLYNCLNVKELKTDAIFEV